MNIPKMPDGYILLEEDRVWYVLHDEGAFMKRLLDSNGEAKCFDNTSQSLASAVVYAQKHKDAGISYDQPVIEVES